MAGAIDGDFVTGDSLSFCSEVSGVETFCTVVCDADDGRVFLFDPQNEKLYKVAKERVQQLTPPGGDTRMIR
jgi:hypothetical protein